MFMRLFALFMIIGALIIPSNVATSALTRQAVARSAPSSGSNRQIQDHYIVVVKPGRNARAVAEAAGVTPKHVYARVLTGFVAKLTMGQRAALQRHPDVTLIEPDQVVEATSTQTIDLTTNGGLWGLDRIDQRSLPLDGQYHYPTAGAGVTAYLIDSGLQATHPEFGTRAQNVYDAFGGSGADCHGHGTHLAGIVGGATYGVAKLVNLRGVRVLDCDALGTVSNAIRGIDWVAANATKPAVATLAFSPVNLSSSNSSTLQLAVENLINAGVFVAVAAGNGNVDACTITPANIAAAYTVAASTITDRRASFSNHGACVDSYAPGSGITSAWIGSTTNTVSGTSQATAFVAGVAALYKAAFGEASQATINAWLDTNATPNQIVNNIAGTPNRLLSSDLPLAKSVVESFEAGSVSSWETYSGSASINPHVVSLSKVGAYGMAVDYTVSPGGYAGVYLYFTPAKPDWSSYTHIEFWFYGTNSGNSIIFMLLDNNMPGSTSDTAERFAYYVRDTFAGWRHLSVPWSAFTRNSWQPPGAPNDGLTLTRVEAITFAPDVGSGTFRVDQVELARRASVYQVVANFENGSVANWETYSGSASINPQIVSPSQAGVYGMAVDYTVSPGGYAGVYLYFTPAKPDWSSYTHIEFWLYGTNSGNTIHFLLSDNDVPGSTSDTAERFIYYIPDTFTGWRHVRVPWSAFTRNSWQPPGAPNDGLTLTGVESVTFDPEGGSGSFRVDQIQVTR
jgi:hypothetical protein